MANSLTLYGQAVALRKDATAYRTGGSETNVGGIAKMMSRLRLYTSASTPAKTGGTWVEATGGGYAAKTLAETNFVLSTVSGNVQAQIDDQTWTAAGGSIANVAGAYGTDADGNQMGWWERATPLTLADGDSITASQLQIRPS